MPNLFIVGAPKCGTTAWVEYLRSHPDIYFSQRKDHCYFGLDLPNFRLINSSAAYAELFAESGSARFIGEASAMYLFSQAAAGAIREHNAESKILIFLRQQDDYLPSLHNQFLWEFAEEIEDFEIVWRLSGRRPPETIPATCLEPRTLDYAAMGRFDEQVERYLAAFPPNQVRVIRFRDWTADPRATYLEILDFLGLEDDGRREFRPVNEGMSYRSRRLARLIAFPPSLVRNAGRVVRRLAGAQARRLQKVAWKAVSLLSKPGYKTRIGRELREDIRRYYAEGNRLLDERLRNLSCVRDLP